MDGPGVINMAITAVQGYKKALEEFRERRSQGLAWNPETLRYEKSDNPDADEFMQLRIKKLKRIAENIRPITVPAWVFAPNGNARKKAREAALLYREVFGTATLKERLISAVLVFTGSIETVRIAMSKVIGREGVVRQPQCLITRYPSREAALRENVPVQIKQIDQPVKEFIQVYEKTYDQAQS
ncbi:MAG: hypothetical protein A2176_14955 [Spirochaetes bacterium RBG_13_51_14]|nr:MAG: hypothetical protein A2176_14955 [Spirochaetes bacterium RBG_13_51_14]